MNTQLNKQELCRAHRARDIRFDGKFFVAVKTTKIYCRPICPARKAKLANLEFFIHAALAEEAGYRPCLRCRPETAPGSTAWLGASALVKRAARIMENSDLESLSINKLANQLNISERWLREVFKREIGLNPHRLLLDKKLSIARNLLDHSHQSITEIAFSAGFNSIRRFNDAFKARFGKAPREIKSTTHDSNTQCLHLRYRPPLAWSQLLNFFSQRTVPTVENVANNKYERLFKHNGAHGWLRVSPLEDYQIKVEYTLNKKISILDFVSRIKAMFDLDADPMSIETDLARDTKLKKFLNTHSGLRIPGCWDSFELAVRAIIGQKISVKAARTILTRLVNLCGEKQTFNDTLSLTHFFPTPKNILAADLSTLGLTRTKAQALTALAQSVYNGELVLDGSADYEETCKTLLAIKGIGPWTIEYIAMRALKNPDAFPGTDLEIQKKLKKFNFDPKKWIPWRAYGVMLLFNLV